MSLLLESDLYMYSLSSERGWPLIPLDIILTETDLYLLWRVPLLICVIVGFRLLEIVKCEEKEEKYNWEERWCLHGVSITGCDHRLSSKSGKVINLTNISNIITRAPAYTE